MTGTRSAPDRDESAAVSTGGFCPCLRTYRAFGEQVSTLFGLLEGINKPTATVLCSACLVELL